MPHPCDIIYALCICPRYCTCPVGIWTPIARTKINVVVRITTQIALHLIGDTRQHCHQANFRPTCAGHPHTVCPPRVNNLDFRLCTFEYPRAGDRLNAPSRLYKWPAHSCLCLVDAGVSCAQTFTTSLHTVFLTCCHSSCTVNIQTSQDYDQQSKP